MSDLSQRPTYTTSQLSAWLDFINPEDSTASLNDLTEEIKNDPLAALRRIQLLQMAAVPFANLQLHYSTHHTIFLQPEKLFVNAVERRMGGYCMENNLFFAIVLRSLGYDLYTAGGRVSDAVERENGDPEDYGGWNHMINIVTIVGHKYLVDVGFGGSCSVSPIRLTSGETLPNVGGSRVRLLYKTIAPSTVSTQKMWVFEAQHSPKDLWKAQYCFTELEFLPRDFAVMNYFTSQHPNSVFKNKLMMSKVIVDHQSREPVGYLTLSGHEVKRRIGGSVEILAQCKTESERVQALATYFGVKLHADEMEGIKGMPSQLEQVVEN